MDWVLSITTVLTNSALGWAKGVWWSWALHALNAVLWIGFAIYLNKYGLILLSAVTILLDVISGIKSWKGGRNVHENTV